MNLLASLAVLSLVLAVAPPPAPCTAFLICGDGEVLFGNNEDYWDTDTRIWFVPATGTKLGYVAVGYDNMYPQGGMNEAGLAFDGFATRANPLHRQEGKTPCDSRALIDEVMTTCSTVEDVVALFGQHDLSWLETAMLQFADASGDSVIIEGDEFVRGDGRAQVCTNFYQSRVDDDRAACPRFDAATEILENAERVSVELCLEALAAAAQETGAPTLYSNVFDLKRRVVYLYNFHNFQQAVVLDLTEELRKGERVLKIPDLFPKTFAYDVHLRRRQAELDEKRRQLLGEPVDRETLDSYAGTYRIDRGPAGAVEVRIRRVGDKLIAATDANREVELLPHRGSEFFVVDKRGTQFVRFEHDDAGAVTGLKARRPDVGRSFDARRVGDG